jgi:hypothetical protein
MQNSQKKPAMKICQSPILGYIIDGGFSYLADMM